MTNNTSNNSNDKDLFVEIQSRLEFQDSTIAELNDVITDQQRQLDLLSARLELLGDKLDVLEESTDSQAENEKPPHY